MSAVILACFIRLIWTSPGGETIRAERITQDGVPHPITLWAPGFAQAITTAAPAGAPQEGYVSITEAPEAWRAGGAAIRLIVGQGGLETAGNLALVAAGVPDTLFRDVAGSRWTAAAGWTGPGNGWRSGWAQTFPCRARPDIRCVGVSRAEPRDSLVAAGRYQGLGPLAHHEDVQRAWVPYLCESYGYVGLRGERDSTLCP